MTTARTWVLVTIAALIGGMACAQDRDDRNGGPEDPRRGHDMASPGLFFTPEIVDLAINRITDEMGRHYKFDEDQLWNARQVIKERFPRFLAENREHIITIVNQYAAALLGEDPPAPEDVADWADRTQPLLNDFLSLVEESGEQMRTFMTEDQQAMLTGEMAMLRVATNHVNSRMEIWRNGGYDWESEWPRSEAFQKKQMAREDQLRTEQESARREALGLPPTTSDASAATMPNGATTTRPVIAKPSGPKDDWTEYVESFIKRYDLNSEQQDQARRILRSLQEQRDSYLRRRLPDIEALEKRQKQAATDEERAKVAAETERINEPLERYFQQLKERLEPLPTRRQRAAAAKAEMESRAKVEPKAGDNGKAGPASTTQPAPATGNKAGDNGKGGVPAPAAQ